MTPFDALKQAIEIAGSQSDLARRCDTYQVRVSRWMAANRVQAEFVLAVEKATGVSRHDLRPDIYPCPVQPKKTRRVSEDGLTPWDTGNYGNSSEFSDNSPVERFA